MNILSAAASHVPGFIAGPGETDVLMIIVAVTLIAAVLGFGVFFFWLHSLPERMVHNKIQFDLVAALALLSLFTHIHAFWVAALLIALIDFPTIRWPEITAPLNRMANAAERMAGGNPEKRTDFDAARLMSGTGGTSEQDKV
jgi:hypothetical protein